ncbi:uncharacterized protein [Littorina saxatilis]|uniref:Uncharacterized protein n=1 Tax=Littorina saxatilis TaxID=31220 RepID=A0AAN9BRB3_9CAEN
MGLILFGALLLLLGACRGFQWVKTTDDGAQLDICSGDPVKLHWYFNLSQGERVKEIEWKHQAENGDVRVVANYNKKNFVPTADFSGRVSHGGTGALELSCATILETGNYTVLVKIVDVANTVSEHRRWATVVINDTPKTLSGELEVRQDRKAVRDVTTNLWHVQLTCGQFSDRGHPPVDVTWTTPDGSQKESSSFKDGNFHLPLPNPTKGGNYSCSLPSFSPATRCLPENSALRNDVTVDVDEVGARFSLLEAHQGALQIQLDDDMTAITTGLNNTASAIMDGHMAAVSKRLDTIDELRNTTKVLQTRLDLATRRVHFHATLGAKISLVVGNHLQPFSNVLNNEGQAFASTTAEFTAPVNGVYFFVGSTGPRTSGKFGNMRLMKEGISLSETYIEQDGTYDVMGTCHATVHLSKGQKVWLECTSQDSTFWEGTAFTGFLVYADN